jgi:hypothetical protein
MCHLFSTKSGNIDDLLQLNVARINFHEEVLILSDKQLYRSHFVAIISFLFESTASLNYSLDAQGLKTIFPPQIDQLEYDVK